jgi:hypothetical protein
MNCLTKNRNTPYFPSRTLLPSEQIHVMKQAPSHRVANSEPLQPEDMCQEEITIEIASASLIMLKKDR